MDRTYTVDELMELERLYLAPIYNVLPAFIDRADGCWAWDSWGHRYLDMLSSYSALNLGHRHPRISEALIEQALEKVSLVPGCFHSPERILFAKELAEFCGKEMVLFKNSGAEAVEASIKLARKWAYTARGINPNQAEIIVCGGNFHGRTTTIVSFSSEPQYKDLFGPHTPGFVTVKYGCYDSMVSAITPNTAAFLVEPIQGEGGVVVPPEGYLARCYEACQRNNILFIADEIQTGLARTGKMFACDHEEVIPDVYILGKALGGGVLPLSAIVGSRRLISVLQPGDDGSTFGGNPLACHVGRETLRILEDEGLARCSFMAGQYFRQKLVSVLDNNSKVRKLRGKGLLIGIELRIGLNNAHELCEELIDEGILCKEARSNVIRLSPPLSISTDEMNFAIEGLARVLA